MPTYSNSRLNKFEECPRAYKFKYIEKVEVERVQNVYFFLGNRVHEALERLHEEMKEGGQMALEELLGIYEESWNEKWSEDIKVPCRNHTPDHFRHVGRECIMNYYSRHGPFERDVTVDTEMEIYPKVRSNGQEYTFLGYVDRLARTPDGTYEVHDYKTSKNLPTKEDMEGDRQLPLYQLGVEQAYPDADEVELVWHYVRFGEDIRISHSRAVIDDIQGELTEVIAQIERARKDDDFPTMRREGANCHWCDYKDLCPAWDN